MRFLIRHDSRGLVQGFPKRYVLEPGDRHLSAEHLAYAYHSVAQRFLFIISKESRPLAYRTLLLGFIPALVATVNLATNIWDMKYYTPDRLLILTLILTLIEALLLSLVTWPLTLRTMRLAVETSMLVHGWYLAVREVWMEEWNERNDDPASPVYVDVSRPDVARIVHKATDAEREEFALPKRAPWHSANGS